MDVSEKKDSNVVNKTKSWIRRWLPRFTMPEKMTNGSRLEQPPKSLDAITVSKIETLSPLGVATDSKESILDYARGFWIDGHDDGRFNKVKSPIDALAHSFANHVRDKLKVEYQARVSELQVEVSVKDEIRTNRKNDYHLSNQYYHDIIERFKTNPRTFSFFLGLFYGLISIILVFADIPLALKLTQEGFSLDRGEGTQAISNLFTNHFWEVLQANWEVFVMALGISLCTVFIKIMWDTFVQRPEKIVSTDTQSNTIHKQSWLARNKWVPYTSVLVLFMATIVMLGFFRHIWAQHIADSLSYGGNEFFTTQTQAVDKDYVSYVNRVTMVTFILITLMFPVISGICASLGLTYLHNRFQLYSSRKLRRKSEKAYNVASKHYYQAKKKLENWTESLNGYSQGSFPDEIKAIFTNYYELGYVRGYLQFDEENNKKDLFQRAQDIRNRMSTYTIYDRFIVNGLGGNNNGSNHDQSN